MARIRRRSWWLLFTVAAGIASVFIGRGLFVEAACPKLQDLILYGVSAIAVLIGLVYTLWTREDSLLAMAISIGSVIGGSLLVTFIAAAVVGQRPEIQLQLCAPNQCAKADLARNLRQVGKLDGAEDVAESCLGLSNVSPGQEEAICSSQCAHEYVLVLLDKVDITLNGLPEKWSPDKQEKCNAIMANLAKARPVAEKYVETGLSRAIEQSQKRADEKCVPPEMTATPPPPTLTPVPTPSVVVEILRQRLSGDTALIDARVLENGQTRFELQVEDFVLTAGGATQKFSLEARNADDPICLIAVVDNSGSIYPGLEEIRLALRKLNDSRKPGDELGLVLFAERNSVRTIQLPGPNPLDPSVVQGSGNLTALWDGILQGLESANSCSVPNRYLIVLTDGRDNDSKGLEGDDETKARKIASLAAEQGVDICTVGVKSDQLRPEALDLAAQGCGYYPAENFEAVAGLFADLFGYIRDFYRITFDSAVMLADRKVELQVLQSAEVTIDFARP